jgi:hypothetical protein
MLAFYLAAMVVPPLTAVVSGLAAMVLESEIPAPASPQEQNARGEQVVETPCPVRRESGLLF